MKRKPNYEHLRVTGCLCYVNNQHAGGDQFAPKGSRCMLIGYPSGQKAYKLYDLDNHKIVVSRDVVFQEHVFPFKMEEIPYKNMGYKTSKGEFIAAEDDDVYEFEAHADSNESPSLQQLEEEPVVAQRDSSSPSIVEEVSSPQVVRRSTRESTLPTKYRDYVMEFGRNQESSQDSSHATMSEASSVLSLMDAKEFYNQDYLVSLNNVMNIKEPNNFYEAAKDPKWVQVMSEELEALEKNGTWDVVDLPQGKKCT